MIVNYIVIKFTQTKCDAMPKLNLKSFECAFYGHYETQSIFHTHKFRANSLTKITNVQINSNKVRKSAALHILQERDRNKNKVPKIYDVKKRKKKKTPATVRLFMAQR